jgi:hypothetical protein
MVCLLKKRILVLRKYFEKQSTLKVYLRIVGMSSMARSLALLRQPFDRASAELSRALRVNSGQASHQGRGEVPRATLRVAPIRAILVFPWRSQTNGWI